MFPLKTKASKMWHTKGMLQCMNLKILIYSTEREIQKALEAASRGRTMLIVAHRFSGLANYKIYRKIVG